jgi:hypothetical protein
MLRIKQYNNFPIAASVEIYKKEEAGRECGGGGAFRRERARERKSSIFLFIYLSSSIMHVFVSAAAAAVREVDFPPGPRAAAASSGHRPHPPSVYNHQRLVF